MNKYFAAALVLLLVGCSSSPTAPSPTPAPTPRPESIAGTWAGSMTLTVADRRGTVQVRATLEQISESVVSGTWTVTTANNDIHGSVNGILTGTGAETQFAGSLTWDGRPDSGTERCTGEGKFNGFVWPSIQWDSAGFAMRNCPSNPPTSIVLSLQR